MCTTVSPHGLLVATLSSLSLIPGTGPGPRKVWQGIRASPHSLPFSQTRLNRYWWPFQSYPVPVACCFGPSCPLVRCRTDSEKFICPLIGDLELPHITRSRVFCSVHSYVKKIQQLILCKTQRSSYLRSQDPSIMFLFLQCKALNA